MSTDVRTAKAMECIEVPMPELAITAFTNRELNTFSRKVTSKILNIMHDDPIMYKRLCTFREEVKEEIKARAEAISNREVIEFLNV